MSTSHHKAADAAGDDDPILLRLQDQLSGRAHRAWSEGRIKPEDDGDLSFAVSADPQSSTVLVDFTRPIEWLAFPPKAARAFAEMLLSAAKELDDAAEAGGKVS